MHYFLNGSTRSSVIRNQWKGVVTNNKRSTDSYLETFQVCGHNSYKPFQQTLSEAEGFSSKSIICTCLICTVMCVYTSTDMMTREREGEQSHQTARATLETSVLKSRMNFFSNRTLLHLPSWRTTKMRKKQSRTRTNPSSAPVWSSRCRMFSLVWSSLPSQVLVQFFVVFRYCLYDFSGIWVLRPTFTLHFYTYVSVTPCSNCLQSSGNLRGGESCHHLSQSPQYTDLAHHRLTQSILTG